MTDLSEIYDTHRPLAGVSGGSETSFGVNLLVLFCSIAVVAACYFFGISAYVELFVILLAALLVFTIIAEAIFYPKTCALRNLHVRRRLSWRRVLFREVALLVVFGAIACVYWLFPMFSDRSMQLCYYPFLKIVVPCLIVASLPYFCLMDRLDPEDEDALCRVGRAIVTRQATMTRFEFGNFVRSWMVKAFWLSVMQPQVIEKIRVFICYHWNKLAGSPMEIFLMASTICYGMDLCYACSGYALNFKLFNSHTRTAEPTLLGWCVAIFCYWPFWGILFYPYFFKYDVPNQWTSIFQTGSVFWWIWGTLIIGLELLYALSTIAAGIRFSNLTYRGLWRTGPYRWTKHPAYVFKNVSWWLIYLPFVVNSGMAAVKCSFLLLATNMIYYLRARTEERHLSHYPEYVAYAVEMNERSIFRWCAQLLPFLRYRPPAESDRIFAVRGT